MDEVQFGPLETSGEVVLQRLMSLRTLPHRATRGGGGVGELLGGGEAKILAQFSFQNTSTRIENEFSRKALCR